MLKISQSSFVTWAPPYRWCSALLALTLCCFAAPAHSARADDNLVKDALATWPVLKDNIKFSTLKTKTQGTEKVTTGKAKAFGQRVTLKAVSTGAMLHSVTLEFPRKKQLKPAQLNDLTGQDVTTLIPPGVGGKLHIKRLEVEFARRKPSALRIVMGAGKWEPFGRGQLASRNSKGALPHIRTRPTSAGGRISGVSLPPKSSPRV